MYAVPCASAPESSARHRLRYRRSSLSFDLWCRCELVRTRRALRAQNRVDQLSRITGTFITYAFLDSIVARPRAARDLAMGESTAVRSPDRLVHGPPSRAPRPATVSVRARRQGERRHFWRNGSPLLSFLVLPATSHEPREQLRRRATHRRARPSHHVGVAPPLTVGDRLLWASLSRVLYSVFVES